MIDTSSAQFLTFVTVLGAGLAYIFISSVLSAIFGFGDDTDADHDTPDSGHETVSIFSPKIVAIFAVGLGAGGTIATYYGADVIVATLSGLGVGAALGGLGLAGLRALYSQQASSEVTTDSAVGLTGTVTSHIGATGLGEVGVNVRGTYLTYPATGRGHSFPRNTQVRVTEVAGTTLVVSSL